MEQVREVQRGYSFQAQHDPRLLFGLDSGREGRGSGDPAGRRAGGSSSPIPLLGRYLEVREP